MSHDPPEHIIEVLPRIDIVILTGLDEAHVQGRRAAGSFAADEQPILSTQSRRPHGILREIVVGPQPAIFDIAAKGCSLIQGVIHGLAKRLRGDGPTVQLLQLVKDTRQDRHSLFLPEEMALLGGLFLAGGLHFMVEPGDARQDVRRFRRTR